MKIVVDSMPDSPSDCLFLKDFYKESCQFNEVTCAFSSWLDVPEEYRICPYLIELKELNR